MIKWVNKGIPLPFGAVKNQRSLVALDNFFEHSYDDHIVIKGPITTAQKGIFFFA